jgi:nuclear pore complex protein Nup160
MCEENVVDRLMLYNFVGVVDEVEQALSFKARNADPRMRPFYSKILYTWYSSRGDYRNGQFNSPRHLQSLTAEY